MGSLGLKGRAFMLFIYMILAYLVYCFMANDWYLQSYTATWIAVFFAYVSYDLIVVKYFVKPHDSVITSASLLLLLLSMEKTNFLEELILYRYALTIIVGLILIVSLVNSFLINNKLIRKFTYKFTQVYGKPEILFIPTLILVSFAYFDDFLNVFVLNLCWVVYFLLKPHYFLIMLDLFEARKKSVVEGVGTVTRIDDPNIITVKLDKDIDWMSSQYNVELSSQKWVQVIPLYKNYKSDGTYGTGYYFNSKKEKDFATPEMRVIKACSNDNFVEKVKTEHSIKNDIEYVGVVVENSNVERLMIELTTLKQIELGDVLFVSKAEVGVIFYQVINLTTEEEVFNSEPRGKLLAHASQLGVYFEDKGFQKYSSTPRMNEMVFLMKQRGYDQNQDVIGYASNTDLPITLDIDKLIKYHAAVLGVTGTGKTELVFKLIEKSLGEKTKVFCLDITGDYARRLSSFNPTTISFDAEYTKELDKLIFAAETGNFGGKVEKGAFLKFVDDKQEFVYNQISQFLDSDSNLAIFELAEIANSRTSLRITQMYLANLFKWAKTNRGVQSIQIVLEEAHTIIPERNSFGFDNVDTDAVLSSVSQIALQGRKYGVGLLVVSQRTALVSKTILSQCNTFFTFNLIDKTSLDFLRNVYGDSYMNIITNLKFRHMLAFGNALSSENPIQIEIPYDKALKDASEN